MKEKIKTTEIFRIKTNLIFVQLNFFLHIKDILIFLQNFLNIFSIVHPLITPILLRYLESGILIGGCNWEPNLSFAQDSGMMIIMMWYDIMLMEMVWYDEIWYSEDGYDVIWYDNDIDI